MLSLPWCLQQASLVPGLALMLLISVMAAVSVVAVCAAAELAGNVYTFKELGSKAVGHGFGVFIQAVVALYTLGSCISYTVLLQDFLPSIVEAISGVEGAWYESRGVLIFILATLVLLPMSLAKDLSRFEFTSTIAVGCVLLTVGILLWRGSDPTGWATVNVAKFDAGTFAAMPILAVATTMHYNSLRFYRELPPQHRNLTTMFAITMGAFFICFLAYAASATAGYVAFGANTSSEVLQNFPKTLDSTSGVLALVVRIAFGIVVTFTYPLSLHPLRAALFSLMPANPSCCGRSVKAAALYVPLTLLLVIVTCVVGWLVPQIDVVLDYKGAIAGSCVVYIAPGIMVAALALRRDATLNWGGKAPLAASNSDEALLDGEAGRKGSAGAVALAGDMPLHANSWFQWLGCGCSGRVAFVCGGPEHPDGDGEVLVGRKVETAEPSTPFAGVSRGGEPHVPTTPLVAATQPNAGVPVCRGKWWQLFCSRVLITRAGALAAFFVLWGVGPMLIGGVLKTAGLLT